MEGWILAGVGTRRRSDLGRADLDHTHRFTIASVYELPFGKNLPGVAKKALAGWATDSIIQLQSGLPMTPQFSGDVAQMGTNQALRPDLICNPNLPRGERTVDRFFNTSCLVQRTPFRYGTSGRAVITGPGTIGIDLAARKNFAFLSERLKAQFPRSPSIRTRPSHTWRWSKCFITWAGRRKRCRRPVRLALEGRTITVYLSPADHTALKDQSRQAGLSLPQYIRTRCGLPVRWVSMPGTEDRDREEDEAWEILDRLGLNADSYFEG